MAPRVTRSASRELSDSEAVHSVAAQHTRSLELMAQSGARQDRSAGRRGRKRKAEGLPTVQENAPDGTTAQKIHPLTSPGAISNISGTTARTSHSAHELGQMNSIELIDHLPDLVQKSDTILNLLAPPNMSDLFLETRLRDLQTPDSKPKRSLDRARRLFRDVKAVYGSEDFIKTSIALRGTLNMKDASRIGDGAWRPDDAFYKANLASLVLEAFSRSTSASEPSLPLEKLDRDFPEPFISRLHGRTRTGSTGSSSLYLETLDLALEIRTQCAVQILRQNQSNPNFDRHEAISQVFYESDNENTLRGWAIKGMDPNAKRDDIISRLRLVSSAVDSDVDANGFRALQEQFPVQKFLHKLITWCRARSSEIDGRLEKNGGIMGVQSELDSETRRRQGLPEIPDNSQTEALHQHDHEAPRSSRYNTIEGINELKKLAEQAATSVRSPLQNPSQTTGDHPSQQLSAPERSVSQQLGAQQDPFAEEFDPRIPAGDDGPSPSGQGTHPAPDLGESQVSGDQEEDDGPPPSERGTQLIHDLQEKRNAYQNKENRAPRSFLNHQVGAKRVNFDDPSQPSSSAARRDRLPPSPSQDDGFQTQEDIPRRNRDVPQSRKRRRDADSERGSQTRRPLQPVRLATAPRRSEDHLDQEEEDIRETQEYPIVSQMAREVTRSQQVKSGRRQRHPWTEREVRYLKRYIEEHGCSWALILRNDKDGRNVLQNRDQYALKDKARNMRFEYEKTGGPLPTNFGNITLKATQKQALQNYHTRPGYSDLMELSDGEA